MRLFFIISSWFVFYCVELSAQSLGCYDFALLNGRIALRNLQFETAITQFENALDCDQTSEAERKNIQSLLKEAYTSYFTYLKNEKNEISKKKDFVFNQLEVLSSQFNTVQQTMQAVVNQLVVERDKAITQAKLAESKRMGVLALKALEEKKLNTALNIAFLAKRNLPKGFEDSLVNTIFVDAVRQISFQTIINEEWKVKKAAFSSDNQSVLLVVHPDKTNCFFHNDSLLILDLEKKAFCGIPNQLGQILAVAYAQKGNQFFATSKNGDVGIWDSSRKWIKNISAHHDAVFAGQIFRDGQMLTCSRDGSAKIWNAEGKLKFKLQHSGAVFDGYYSVKHKRIATRSADKTIKLWESETGHLIKVLERHSLYIYDLDLSPNEEFLVSASANRKIRFWDIKGNMLSENSWGKGELIDLAFSKSGQAFYWATTENKIRFADLDGNVITNLDFDNQPITAIATDASNQIAVGLEDGRVILKDYVKGTTVMEINPGFVVKELLFSQNDKYLFGIGKDGKAFVCMNPEIAWQDLTKQPPLLTDEEKIALGVK